MRPTLKEQETKLRRAAKSRGLKVRKDPRLTNTPYRAMQPYAAKELGVPCPKDTITYSPAVSRSRKKLVMDLRHELTEYDLMSKGRKYKSAHKLANRKQRAVGGVK